MGANGSKSFQQVGAVATGLTSWVSGARKRRAAGVHKLDDHDDQQDPVESDEDDESPAKLAKTENDNHHDHREHSETESKQLVRVDNGTSDCAKAFDKMEDLKSNGLDHLTPIIANDVDEGVGLDVADEQLSKETSPLLSTEKEDESNGQIEEACGTNGTSKPDDHLDTTEESKEEETVPACDVEETGDEAEEETETEERPLMDSPSKRKSQRKRVASKRKQDVI